MEFYTGKVLTLIAHIHAVFFGTDIIFAPGFQMQAIAIYSSASRTGKLLLFYPIGKQGRQDCRIVLNLVASAFSAVDTTG